VGRVYCYTSIYYTSILYILYPNPNPNPNPDTHTHTHPHTHTSPTHFPSGLESHLPASSVLYLKYEQVLYYSLYCLYYCLCLYLTPPSLCYILSVRIKPPLSMVLLSMPLFNPTLFCSCCVRLRVYKQCRKWHSSQI
jgi:hypothetical protein